MENDAWIVARPATSARARIFCFSYAGGNAASYMQWNNDLSPYVQVCAIQIPGRGARFNEPSITDFSILIPQIANSIAAYNDLPFFFFGHSLGALIAYEVCHHLNKNNLPLPEHLIVSAANSPSSPSTIEKIGRMDSDYDIIERLRYYGGTPEELLKNKGLMQLLMPAIKADFTLLDNYRYRRDRKSLSIPLTAMGGHDDNILSKSKVANWEIETTNEFKQHWFNGGHFYFNDDRTKLISELKLLINNSIKAY